MLNTNNYNYQTMKNKQLVSINDTYDFTNTLIEQINNDYWKQKQDVWYILSAACNDAASNCFIKINDYVKNLADIEVCNIHALKSIAKSIGAEHLTDFINENYPIELQNLINIFSIKSSKLLQLNQKLKFNVLLPIYGNLDQRNLLIHSTEAINNTLLIDIYNNIQKIQKLLNYNNCNLNISIDNILNRYVSNKVQILWREVLSVNAQLTEKSKIYIYNPNSDKIDFITFDNSCWVKKISKNDLQEYDFTKNNFNQVDIQYVTNKNFFVLNCYSYNINNINNIESVTTQTIIDNIKNIKKFLQNNIFTSSQETQIISDELNNTLNNKLKTKQVILSQNDIKSKIIDIFNSSYMFVNLNSQIIINPFFLLIQLMKNLIFEKNKANYFVTQYNDKSINSTIDLTQLCKDIIQTINKYDEAYIYKFIYYHINNLFSAKISNEIINKDFEIDQNGDLIYKSNVTDYTREEFVSKISSYLNETEIEIFLGENKTIDDRAIQINHYKKEYVDFIKYLYLVNSIYEFQDGKPKFPYLLQLYNNNYDISHDYNITYRTLFGLDIKENNYNYLLNIVSQFVDICLKISYIRDDIKGLIQQYSFIGTQRIITDVIRDYFIKNFSKRSSWRYISNLFTNKDKIQILQNNQLVNQSPLKTIEQLNNKNSYFKPSIIEYYDSTQYLNIIADLPSCICDYEEEQVFIQSTFFIEEQIISTYILKQDVISTVLEQLPFEIPQSLYPKMDLQDYTIPAVILSSEIDTRAVATQFIPSGSIMTSGQIEIIKILSEQTSLNPIQISPSASVSAQVYPSAIVSSILIPSGTQVSATIPPYTFVTSTVLITQQKPIYGLCADFIDEYNEKYWQRNISKLTYNDLKDQINFYQRYFSQLQNAKSNALKTQIYKEQIYPLLSSIWDIHAVSGFLGTDLEDLQYKYSGSYPGKFLTVNVGNTSFPTIAPLPFINNFLETNTYDNDDSYLIKPIYDNIAYYMNLVLSDIFDMYKTTSQNLAIAQQGWKQINIQMKGYTTKYEIARNTLENDTKQLKEIDVDGPWVYSSLKNFLNYYISYNNNISQKIDLFIDTNYFNLSTIQKNKLKQQLIAFQHNIYEKQEWKIIKYQIDTYKNQFVLFKHKDHKQFEDTGQIWIRINNHALAIPLMKNNIKFEFKNDSYQKDILDTVQYSDNVLYINMFKQLCNNCLNFGVIQNTIWILGFTEYILNENQNLIKLENNLKLVCFTYQFDQSRNVMNIIHKSSFAVNELNDLLNNINEFVGVYYNSAKNTLDFVLYDYETTSNIFSTKNFNEINFDFAQIIYRNIKSAQLDFNIISYDLANYEQNFKTLKVENMQYPLIQILSTNININENYSQLSTTNNNFYGDTVLLTGSTFLIQNQNQLIFLGSIIYEDSNILTGNVYLDNNYIGTFNGIYNPQKLTRSSSTQILDSEIYNIQYNIKYDDKNYSGDKNTLSMLSGQFILPQKVSKDIGYNIWRLSKSTNNISIAYQAMNQNLTELYEFFLMDQLLSQYNYISYLNFNGLLASNQIIDSSNNIIYINQLIDLYVDGNNTSTVLIKLKENDQILNNKLVMIQQAFPSGNITIQNNLIVNTIPTTLGGYKDAFVLVDNKTFSDEHARDILTGLIKSSKNEALQSFKNVIKTEQINNVPLNTNLNNFKQVMQFNENAMSGYINFNTYYKEYLTYINNQGNDVNTQIQILNKHNNQMEKLCEILKFAPAVTDLIYEPIKIIFSFGNATNTEYLYLKDESFDLDINVYINTQAEKNNKVGWRCGLSETKYLKWISNDSRFGKPEIVLVDVEKYQNRNTNDSLDIIINACWFNESQITSVNPNIIINWRGFLYHFIIEDILYNQSCCDFEFLKLHVDFNTNALYCSRMIYLPTIIYKPNQNNIYMGYIHFPEINIDSLFNEQSKLLILNQTTNHSIIILNKKFTNLKTITEFFNQTNVLQNFNIIKLKYNTIKYEYEQIYNLNKELYKLDYSTKIDYTFKYYNKYILI